jgi:hypothetical protein
MAPQAKVKAAPRSNMKSPALGLAFLCVGVGALFGSGVLSEGPFESQSLTLIKNIDIEDQDSVRAHLAPTQKLSVRENARLRVTNDDLPFKSLNKVSHALEIPSVKPIEVRYRERLASFTTTQPEALPVAYDLNSARSAVVAPTRYVGTTSVTPPSRSHMTSRVLSIIKKHAPKNRNSKILAEAIVRESLAQAYDPLFVAAVIKTESLFNPVARSNKGAQGLMQIMPATGAWLANRESLPRQRLTDTGHNLRLGITYLKQLESEYNGDRVFTLVAYNWGPGHVQMASGGKRRIPGECLRYAVRILNDYRRWKSGVI